MDSRLRALAKAGTWRIVALAITAACAWLVTGEIKYAASIGLADTVIKLGSYYFHERLWDRARVGKPGVPYGSPV